MQPTPQPDQPKAQQGDESALFAQHADRLAAIVRHEVNTSDAVIEDACAFAWAQLLDHQPRRETVLSWLVTVAKREALRLDRIERRTAKLDAEEGEPVEDAALRAVRGDIGDLVELADALDVVRALPVRKQRFYLLAKLGYTYAEIAALTGDTPRTVNRQMARTNDLVREIKARRQQE